MRHGRLGTIIWADILAILTLDALLRQLGPPPRGVWALTSSELPWAVPTRRPNLIHYAIGDSA
jgi:hypothetical protein